MLQITITIQAKKAQKASKCTGSIYKYKSRVAEVDYFGWDLDHIFLFLTKFRIPFFSRYLVWRDIQPVLNVQDVDLEPIRKF